MGFKQSILRKEHEPKLTLIMMAKLDSAHPQTASFGPERRFRSFEILEIARYACGFKIAQALL